MDHLKLYYRSHFCLGYWPSARGSFHVGCQYSCAFLSILDWTGTAIRIGCCHNTPSVHTIQLTLSHRLVDTSTKYAYGTFFGNIAIKLNCKHKWNTKEELTWGDLANQHGHSGGLVLRTEAATTAQTLSSEASLLWYAARTRFQTSLNGPYGSPPSLVNRILIVGNSRTLLWNKVCLSYLVLSL